MKKYAIIIIILAMAGLYSCETYDSAYPDFDNTYPAYVELEDASDRSLPEGATFELTLQSRNYIYTEYTVSYEISGDYSMTGSIDVPSGVNEYTFTITLPQGIVTSEDLNCTFALTDVTNDMAAGRTEETATFDLTITKFVPFEQSDYVATFDCDEPGYKVYPCEFIAGPVDTILTNTNFWDWGLSIDYSFSADFDQKITIEPQTFTDLGPSLTVSGSGTYDGITKTMVVAYKIEYDDGTIEEENIHTFTLQTK
jgi:hypothetical protein